MNRIALGAAGLLIAMLGASLYTLRQEIVENVALSAEIRRLETVVLGRDVALAEFRRQLEAAAEFEDARDAFENGGFDNALPDDFLAVLCGLGLRTCAPAAPVDP